MNREQKQAIETTEGPLLVLAGPGTGKTETIIERTLYLIRKKLAAPEEILIATFSNKARDELLGRLTSRLDEEHISYNPERLLIGTFHSLSRRFLEEFREESGLPLAYRIADRFEQHYLVWMHWEELRQEYPKTESLFPPLNARTALVDTWEQSLRFISLVDRLSDENISLEALREMERMTGDSRFGILCQAVSWYEKLMKNRGFIDFSSLLRMALRLLVRHPEVLEKLHHQIRYLMIDEYQDTTPVQEQFLRLLAGPRQNFCAVGDDDQALYRFRGATTDQILHFKTRFPGAKVVTLSTNYRSGGKIVSFCSAWMKEGLADISPELLSRCRMKKEIHPVPGREDEGAVMRLTGRKNVFRWADVLADCVFSLKQEGIVRDYSEIAFLFSSIRKNFAAREIKKALEARGIRVFAPREGSFFEQPLVRLALASLISLFPRYASFLEEHSLQENPPVMPKSPGRADYRSYYAFCLADWKTCTASSAGAPLRAWVRSVSQKIASYRNEKQPLPFTYTDLLYELLALSPFKEALEKREGTAEEKRAVLSLSTLSRLFAVFDDLYRVRNLSYAEFYNALRDFFEKYLALRRYSGVPEQEEEQEIPCGAVPFLTIHQSKGMEFPVVFVDSLDQMPYESHEDPFLSKLHNHLFPQKEKEPAGLIPRLDFLRKYYTAFSRAENLLVLTAQIRSWTGRNGVQHSSPSEIFRPFYGKIPEMGTGPIHPEQFRHKEKRIKTGRKFFSYTSDMAPYLECPRQYEFLKVLHFTVPKSRQELFGTLMHNTLEMIHRSLAETKTNEMPLSLAGHMLEEAMAEITRETGKDFSEGQKEEARRELSAYVEKHQGRWDHIVSAEWPGAVPVGPYLLRGRPDLIVREEGRLGIVDFKTGKKPDSETSPVLRSYKKQLAAYAFIVEKTEHAAVQSLKLYFLSDPDPLVAYTRKEIDVEGTIKEFSRAVDQIEAGNFSGIAPPARDGTPPPVCHSCPLRWFCGRE